MRYFYILISFSTPNGLTTMGLTRKGKDYPSIVEMSDFVDKQEGAIPGTVLIENIIEFRNKSDFRSFKRK